MKIKNITIKKGAQVMNNNKNVKYSSYWYEIADDKNKTYKINHKLINVDISLGSLVRLKEYNKSLFALWVILQKNTRTKNKIIQTLSEQYKNFHFYDFLHLHNDIEKFCKVGLQDEKNLNDCKIFSGDNIIQEKQDTVRYCRSVDIYVEKGAN